MACEYFEEVTIFPSCCAKFWIALKCMGCIINLCLTCTMVLLNFYFPSVLLKKVKTICYFICMTQTGNL